jgi:hypothetical protein
VWEGGIRAKEYEGKIRKKENIYRKRSRKDALKIVKKTFLNNSKVT